MFFNEDLYLEGEDAATAEVTDEEITEAVEETGGLGAVSEDFNFYVAGLEFLNESTEYYYNLREKMMNIEHVAGIKAAQGLIAESETILSESADAFLDKVKNFFEKVKNGIINLFNKFVNFITSLFVSSKSVLNMDVMKVFDAKRSRGYKLKARVYNVSPDKMDRLSDNIKTMLKDFTASVIAAEVEFSKFKPGMSADQIKASMNTLKEKYDSKLKDRVHAAHKLVNSAILDSLLSNSTSGNYRNSRIDTVLQKREQEIGRVEFELRMDYAKKYKDKITDLKVSRDSAVKTCDEAIKSLKKMRSKTEASDENKELRELQGLSISFLRQQCRRCQLVFAKLTNVMSSYYRECIAIGKKIIGANKAKENKDKIKRLGEGFDFEDYFA